MMNTKFTMVMDQELAEKMSYIGKYYGRSRIKEIEWCCRQYITEWESKNGEITRKDRENREDT